MLRLPTLFSLFCLFSVFLIGNIGLFAQQVDVLMTNSKKIDSNRYKDIKGTPYLFKDWKAGKIISVDADVIEGILVNFNGKTNGFEIRKGKRFIELNPQWYIRVIVVGEKEEDAIIFQKNFVAPLKNKFTRLVYKGKQLRLVEAFTAEVITKVFNNVGKNEKFKSFYHKRQYYLIKDKKPILLKLKKKNLLELLGHEEELDNFIKEEKMKLKTEAELIKLLTFYEDKGFGL